jgi:hypothetical protein
MKHVQDLRTLLALTVVAATTMVSTVNAAGIKQDEQRLQVKMERDEWIKTHRWDPVAGEWVLKSNALPPKGVKSRDEIKAERDAFLRAHRWDREQGWVPLKTERSLSARSRAEVKAETAQFSRTHRWDEGRDSFVSTGPAFSRQ